MMEAWSDLPTMWIINLMVRNSLHILYVRPTLNENISCLENVNEKMGMGKWEWEWGKQNGNGPFMLEDLRIRDVI